MLRILVIDDNPHDRLLAIRSLERELLNFQVQEITNAEDLTLALDANEFDLVITDYQLRWSDGLAVLLTIKDRYPECPVIMFTNSGTQEIAVEAMKAGLDDYVIKSPKHYIRLATAVRSAWEKVQTRRKVTGLENRLQSLLNQLNVGVFRLTIDGCLLEANRAFLRLLGLRSLPESSVCQSLEVYFESKDYAQVLNQLKQNGQIQEREVQLRQTDGSLIWVRLSQTLRTFEGQTIIDGLMEDISDRKQAQQERTQLLEELAAKQRLLEAVLQQMPTGVLIAEASSEQIVLMNEQVKQILRGPYSRVDKVEEYLQYETFYPNGQSYTPEELPLVRSLRTGEVVTAEEIDLVRGDHTRGTLLVNSAPIRDSEGRIVAGVVNFLDITDRKQAQEELQNALQKLNFHVENTPLAVIERDRDFRVTRWSKAAERIFGWRAEEVIGNDWQGVFSDDLETVKTIRARLFNGDEKQNISHNRSYTKDGSIVDCEWYNSALLDKSGNLVSVLSLVLDVTERKRTEAERDRLLKLEKAARADSEAARSAAETANRLKDEFLAVLSHELRSPLNSILGWAKLLRTRTFDEATTARALETIERNANLQTQLIEDLLDVSRIMRGKTSLKISPVNLATTIEAAIDTVRLAAQAKSIQLQCFIDPTVTLISGDPNRLQQVIWNLLSNAIKFTPSGGRVSIHLKRQDTQAQLLISDTGKGISADFLPHVFEYFRQADSSSTRNHGGLGLGLAIVHHLVELHGGTVEASSPGVGQGATFTVTLPLKIDRTQVQDSEQILPTVEIESVQMFNNPSVLQGKRVLVVDDEADTREFYTLVLEECGASVTAVSSVSDALESLRQQRPDVLLSDIGMPVQDGYALLRQVRALEVERGGRLPAVALTAYARDLDRQQAIAAGFEKHLPKPVEPAELVAVVANLAGVSDPSYGV